MFTIDVMSRVPVYEQLIKQVEDQVLKGIMKEGDKMPSVRSLSMELSTNPNTIQKAYMELEAEALISGEGDMTAKAKAMEVIARKAGIKGMVGGQAVDVELTGKALSDEQLDFIFRLKTGALIEAAFLAGAYLAGCDEKSADRLCRAASLIGFAFQIRDDILDVTSSLQELGKPVFSDEKNNKTTYVTLYGMEKAEADVQSMSDEALDIIKSVGKNEFLEEIVLNLIHRNK